MDHPADRTVVSADGTRIAVSSTGDGPALIVIGGAFDHRGTPYLEHLVAALAGRFRVVTYDRRGRGSSGDTGPWSIAREVDDLAAVVRSVDGPVDVLALCVGTGVLVHAIAAGVPVRRAVLWEPPYRATVDPHADDVLFAHRLDELVGAGRRAAAVRAFLIHALGFPVGKVSALPLRPALWRALLADAAVLSRDVRMMNGLSIPERTLTAVGVPVLVVAGTTGPDWMKLAAQAVVEAIPGSEHTVIAAGGHAPDPAALAPAVERFLLR